MSPWHTRTVTNWDNYFSDAKIEELIRILGKVDEYTIRNVPLKRANAFLFRFAPELRSSTVILEPSFIGGDYYYMVVSRSGVQHA